MKTIIKIIVSETKKNLLSAHQDYVLVFQFDSSFY